MADASEVDSMKLEVDYDDGFIAWLNDVEVARSSLMTGGKSCMECYNVFRS